MRKVIWEDKNGWKHASLVRDNDPDKMAPKGIPCDVPDFTEDEVRDLIRDLHNIRVDRGMFTYKDIQEPGKDIRSAIQTTFFQRMLALYKEKAQENREAS